MTPKKPTASGADNPVGEIVAEIDKLVDQQAEAECDQAKGRPAGEPMGADEARTLTDEIKECLTVGAEKIAQAYDERADVALGYESWDAYCIAEFSSLRLRVPREERPEMVASLRNAGLSIRAIASATGAGVGTIHREIEAGAAARALGVPIGTPAESVDEEQIGAADQIAEELIAADRARSSLRLRITDRIAAGSAPIIGTDGKTYRPQRKPAPIPGPPPSGGTVREIAVVYAQREPEAEPTPTQRRSDDNEIKFILVVRSILRDLDTLMGFAKALDPDAKRRVIDTHQVDLANCAAKLVAINHELSEVS